MEYYFNIAGIIICIVSEVPLIWNQYIRNFMIAPCKEYDEYYECKYSDHFSVNGTLIYENSGQKIYKNGTYEERLHYFWGYSDPCMLYKEYDNRKVIYLNPRYKESFQREDSYCIFNALAFEKVLLQHNSVVLHSSFIIWNEQAILFTAPSGTGKSTQAELWRKYQNVVIANGDRTILREYNGKIYAFGMPICGSSDICLNVAAPVCAIVYLSQSPINTLQKISMSQKVKYLISETTISFFDKHFLDKALDIVMHISTEVDMYHLCCTKDESAVHILKDKLEEKFYESDQSFESH